MCYHSGYLASTPISDGDVPDLELIEPKDAPALGSELDHQPVPAGSVSSKCSPFQHTCYKDNQLEKNRK
ncbi:hypothetical protein ElyMa_003817900 [Elysia marginata]|uniref:CTNNB1 binding N-teminal domain-containing protein n=1 Tax=Elysia marginata TaxID=1093978 RepID=A0AAV4FGX6_9GAST|nr:hypothetical protein ElyMa_003817900 [Elysia marginata]